MLVRNLRAQSEIRNHERDERVSVHTEPSVEGGGGGKGHLNNIIVNTLT